MLKNTTYKTRRTDGAQRSAQLVFNTFLLRVRNIHKVYDKIGFLRQNKNPIPSGLVHNTIYIVHNT